MKNHNKDLLALFGLGILATVTALAALPVRNQKISTAVEQQKGNKEMPIADFALPEPVDPQERALRQARGSRYNSKGREPIAELAFGAEELPLNSHWWWGLPALPARMSDAVIVGEVVGTRAYLSSDRTGVYSEFTVRIDDVLKNDSSVAVVFGGEVVVERPGGVVRFPSGHLQRYSIAQQGMPMSGRRYLFFLKCNDTGQDFSLLTGYELRKGRVTPLDGYDSKGEHAIPSFTAFEGMDETAFFKAVSDAMSNVSQDLLEKGKRNK